MRLLKYPAAFFWHYACSVVCVVEGGDNGPRIVGQVYCRDPPPPVRKQKKKTRKGDEW